MTGYDVAISKDIKGLFATWLISAPATMPSAAKIRWSYIQAVPSQSVATTENYGAPTRFLTTDGTATAFNCANRLCVLDQSRRTPTISLVSADENEKGIASGWIVIDRVRYLVAGYKGQLSMFRP
jgi:hypothetical protein